MKKDRRKRYLKLKNIKNNNVARSKAKGIRLTMKQVNKANI